MNRLGHRFPYFDLNFASEGKTDGLAHSVDSWTWPSLKQ